MKVRDFSKLYFGLLVLHLAVIYKPESQALYNISKPALMFSLGAFAIHRGVGWRGLGKFWIILALGASFAGDILQLIEIKDYLPFILLALALSHLAYSMFFMQLKLSPQYIFTVPVALGCALGIYFMIDKVGFIGASTPILLALVVLAAVHMVKSVQFAANSGEIRFLPIAGAVVFVASNALLLIHEIEAPGKYWEMGMALCYALGHFLIVVGLLHDDEREEVR